MKHRVLPYRVIGKRFGTRWRTHTNTSSPDIEDPYLAELGSTIAQFQDSRIITKEDTTSTKTKGER